jgi:hypothetical protein
MPFTDPSTLSPFCSCRGLLLRLRGASTVPRYRIFRTMQPHQRTDVQTTRKTLQTMDHSDSSRLQSINYAAHPAARSQQIERIEGDFRP